MSDNIKVKGQLELGQTRLKEPDRNRHRGGRSFYFFDFDDNIAHLTTPLVLFHKHTKEEVFLSSGEWALHHATVGKSGPFVDYEIRFDDEKGSFRYFRDIRLESHHSLENQLFVKDILHAMNQQDLQWKGHSWDCFFHATFNQRPISIITARGHSEETIKAGIQQFVKAGYLPVEPNYLSIYAVSNKDVRRNLGDHELKATTAELKQLAIRASVEKAIEEFGYSPHHRFGMSDDDPKNIQLVVEEMTRLKSNYPEMSFFMIETHKGNFVKHEISQHGYRGQDPGPEADAVDQLDLFGHSRRRT